MDMLALFESLMATAAQADKTERERLKKVWREIVRGQQVMISAMSAYILDEEPGATTKNKIN